MKTRRDGCAPVGALVDPSRWRSRSRSARPTSYCSHVMPSTPGAASRLSREEAFLKSLDGHVVQQGSEPCTPVSTCCLSHTIQSVQPHRAGSVSGMRPPTSCFPQSFAFPPPPPSSGQTRLCSAVSLVLRERPTSQGRSCAPESTRHRPSPADPPYHRRVPVGSPVSRAESFHACTGSPTARGPKTARQ